MATSSQATVPLPAPGPVPPSALVSPPSASPAPSSSSNKDTRPPSSLPSSPRLVAPGAVPERDKQSLNRVLVERFITRDWIHSAALRELQARDDHLYHEQHDKLREYRTLRHDSRHLFPPSRLYGDGYRGFGNGHTDERGPRLLYPQHKPRLGRRSTPVVRSSRKDALQQADQHEELVPVRLDVDWDKVKLRDTFTWNLHERLLPIELFAAQLTEDMGLKPPLVQPVYDQVTQQMHEQLNDFYPVVFSEEDALDPELPYAAYKNDEMRILVKLNITIGQHTLVDQFEWEMNNPMNSPEEFAASMARELSLSGEFTTAIAHCIREQTQLFTKSLYSIGHPFDGRPVEDADLVAAFLPSPLPAVFRPQQQAKEYAPYLYELSDADLERNEVIFSREQRRQKRSVNRRGGPQLPDLKERQRTIRTLIVSSVLPGAAVDVEDSRLFKRAAGTHSSRKRGARDGDLSDSDESEDSSPDSPGLTQLQSTARTRNMRGAATAAQQRMANLGRSETPEAATIHHHETRTSRRSNRDNRESSEEPVPAHLMLTIKVSRERLRRFLREAKSRQFEANSAPTAVHPTAATPVTPAQPAPGQPPGHSSLPSGPLGRVPAGPPPPPGQAAPQPVSLHQSPATSSLLSTRN
jgi:SWI/SNF-related matrix-associated actin-dependent regulator of chromatin subfamily B member 1